MIFIYNSCLIMYVCMYVGQENNQGVHVCHKCGWPFPKLHPSSKHRRAHKRICGTIQGYKLTHLNASDGEQDHPSDEDCKTPS